jgi:hypothetical protein
VYTLLTLRPALKNTGSLMPLSLTASHKKTFAGKLVLRITWHPLLLGDLQTHNNFTITTHYLQTWNRFVDRFNREKVFCQELQPSFDYGLFSWCGFRCGFFGFAVDSHLCQMLFDSVVMNLDLPLRFTIWFCAATRCLFLQGSTNYRRRKSTFFPGTNYFLHFFLLLIVR